MCLLYNYVTHQIAFNFGDWYTVVLYGQNFLLILSMVSINLLSIKSRILIEVAINLLHTRPIQFRQDVPISPHFTVGAEPTFPIMHSYPYPSMALRCHPSQNWPWRKAKNPPPISAMAVIRQFVQDGGIVCRIFGFPLSITLITYFIIASHIWKWQKNEKR